MNSSARVAFLIALVQSPAHAFVPNMPKRPLRITVGQSAEPSVKNGSPSWVNLPRPQEDDELTASMPSAEQWVGRLAMIGAVGLFIGEITTGESVSEQVMDLISGL
jgi:hypothetical protein